MSVESKRSHVCLLALGLAQLLLFLMIAKLSFDFVYNDGTIRGPIAQVVALLAVAFVFYLAGLWIALRSTSGDDAAVSKRGSRRLSQSTLIFGFALLFRAALVWTPPIQEVDIYRYLWDGRVLQAGVNPYKYAPQDLFGQQAVKGVPDDLVRLCKLRDASPSIATTLSRVHFPEVPTVYPPASQAVFWLAATLTPLMAPVAVQIVMMKLVLLVFDVGTMLTIAGIVRRLNLAAGWLIAYSWCPLVLKEFANSGHLDSIAVCLTARAILVLLPNRSTETAKSPQRRRYFVQAMVSAALLAMATLAKLYPLVLVLLLLRWSWDRFRVRVVWIGATYLSIVLAGYLPFLGETKTKAPDPSMQTNPALESDSDSAAKRPFAGLATFLGEWEMNDLLFSVVVENLRPGIGPTSYVWYAVIPHDWRLSVFERTQDLHRFLTSAPIFELPFEVARVLLGAQFVILALAIAFWRCDRGDLQSQAAPPSSSPEWLVRSVFLTLGWFWYLSPVQNPWYWIWALPFVMCAGRAWLLTAGFTLLYYLRFWFEQNYPDGSSVWSTRYAGADFFDHVVVWFEHLPVLVLVFVGWLRSLWKSKTPTAAGS